MSDLRPTIARLLSNMASMREVQLYLKRFSGVEADRFAVVKVGGAVLQDETPALVSSLDFLQQVGLTPIVVHGGGPQLDRAMQSEGVEAPVVDGLRVTTEAGLAVVRRVLQSENLRLVEALQAGGVRATPFQAGVFESAFLDRERFGFVGKVVRVRPEGLRMAIQVGSIPVIASLGETAGGQILNVNADWAANELVKHVQPYKIIFLTRTGGLLDQEGRLIETVNLSSDYDHLMAQPWVHSGMRVKLEQIRDLLMALPHSSSLSITRPDEMAQELFTHRGSGTLVRRGEAIRIHQGWDGVDQARLRELIESSFGAPLEADWFRTTRPLKVYLTEHYRAALVLVQEGELPYMDKFVVDRDAQGEGLGRTLWKVMRAQTPRLFWRSRRGNPANEFYFALADGSVRDERWRVYWAGDLDWDQIRFAVDHARGRPPTILRPAR